MSSTVGFVAWYTASGPTVQVAMGTLCGLEFLALSFLVYITWQ